jgi:competence protein ComEA
MSDLPPELTRPPRPATWRERLLSFAESLDMTPARLLVGGAAVVVLSVVGWRLLDAPPPPVEMELPMATTTPSGSAAPGSPGTTVDVAAEVVVHVAGAVAKPGVQQLPPGSRVVDAVDAAGGALPDADVGRVNLAAPLDDGQQVYVPKVGEAAPAAGSTGEAASPSGPVHLNSASVDQLDELPGVGPAIAQAIVDHRETQGDFTSVEDLLDVRGIGQSKLEDLRPLVAP